MGAPSTPPAKTYFGSAAQIVGVGPADILHQIRNGDTVVWSGPIMRLDAMDLLGRTVLTTSIGTIRFYWGTFEQEPDGLLASMMINQGNGLVAASIPAFGGIIYAVLDDCAFGQQTTPPSLQFITSKFPNRFSLPGRVTRCRITDQGSGYSAAPAVTFSGGGGSGAAGVAVLSGDKVAYIRMTATGTGYTSPPAVTVAGPAAAQAYCFHELDGDCLLPEFIYDAFADTFWGLGIPEAYLNLASFVEACEVLINEDIGASPNFDELLTAREMVGKLLPYMDAVIFFKAGQIHFKLIRRTDTTGATELTEADFTDEPLPKNRGFADTSNYFRLTFSDRANNYEDTPADYDNPANAEIVGQSVDSQLDFPYITRRKVANAVVKRIGLKQSKPSFFYEARLQPTHNNLHPGDVVLMSYAKLGFVRRPCRVMEIERSSPAEPEVTATLMVEHTRDTSHDYVVPVDAFLTPAAIDPTGTGDFAVLPVSPRLQTLPPGLKGSSADGVLVAYDRTDLLLRYAKIHWTWDETQKAYAQLGFKTQFPFHATVVAWHQLSPTNWLLRVRFASTAFRNAFHGTAPTAPEWHFVCGQHRVRLLGTPSDTHELAGLWGTKVESGYFAAVDTDLEDIEVTVGAFGSPAFAAETVADAAVAPGTHIYFGARDDFFIFPTDVIAFERAQGNAPINPQTGSSADTAWERLFKVTVANHKNEEALADVSSVKFDRNDFTMGPGGTYTPDWGPRAPSSPEAFDLRSGGYFYDPDAPGYPDLDDADEALGRIFEGTATDADLLLWGPVDEMLGAGL